MSALGQKQTCAVQLGMSAMGQKRTCGYSNNNKQFGVKTGGFDDKDAHSRMPGYRLRS